MTAAQGLPAVLRSLFLQAENLLVANPPTAWLPFSCWREQGAGGMRVGGALDRAGSVPGF
jgi:hypothetical protein